MNTPDFFARIAARLDHEQLTDMIGEISLLCEDLQFDSIDPPVALEDAGGCLDEWAVRWWGKSLDGHGAHVSIDTKGMVVRCGLCGTQRDAPFLPIPLNTFVISAYAFTEKHLACADRTTS